MTNTQVLQSSSLQPNLQQGDCSSPITITIPLTPKIMEKLRQGQKAPKNLGPPSSRNDVGFLAKVVTYVKNRLA